MKIKMFSKTLFQYLPAFCRLSHSIFCLEIESIDNFDKSHRKAQLKISQWVVKNFKWNLLVLRPDTGSGEIQLCNKTKIDLGRSLIAQKNLNNRNFAMRFSVCHTMMSRDVCHVDMSRCRYQDWHRSRLLSLIISATRENFNKAKKHE